MYAQGTEIYCAPTADDRATWAPSMVHIALEGRVHVLSARQAIKLGEYPPSYSRSQSRRQSRLRETTPRARPSRPESVLLNGCMTAVGTRLRMEALAS